MLLVSWNIVILAITVNRFSKTEADYESGIVTHLGECEI
jgi:hypothetical protein